MTQNKYTHIPHIQRINICHPDCTIHTPSIKLTVTFYNLIGLTKKQGGGEEMGKEMAMPQMPAVTEKKEELDNRTRLSAC